MIQRRLPTPRWRGLLLQLFLFIVLPLTALLVAIPLGSLTLHARAMRDLVGERDSRAARAAADSITEQLNHRAAAIRGLALRVAAPTSPELILADYDFLLPDFEGGLALFAADGTLLAASNAPEAWRDRPIAELLTHVAGQVEPQFSAAFKDPASGNAAILVASAQQGGPSAEFTLSGAEGLRAGPVAVGAFFPASLGRRALAGVVSSSDQINAWIVDDQNHLLYQTGTPRPETDLTQHAGVADALRGESGTLYLTVGGSEHVVSYTPVQSVGLALVIEEPWEAVDNPLLRQTLAAPLILIPALLFALIALWFGIRQIIQPLQALERKAAELGWGHFDVIEQPVGGIAEIRHLQAELIRMAQKVKAAQRNLRSYVTAITTGQEDERRRLARGLHDDTVQALIALDQRVQLTQLTAKKAAPDAADRLAEIRHMIAALIEDVRRVIRALRPIYLEDLGLLPALEMLTHDLEKSAGLRATFTSDGAAARLTPEREIAAYRCAQEALSNVARHAEARTVHVSATFGAGEFVLQVQDDGKGFSAPERVSDLAAAGHYGLMGMQERAELIGGRLSIQSAPGSGTTVELRVPL
jgi:signal transduction histidine kinase